MVFMSPAFAAHCIPSQPPMIVTFGDSAIQADLPIGSVIAHDVIRYFIQCTRDGLRDDEWSWLIHLSPDNYSAGKPIEGLNGVVPTGTPGIGLRWVNWTDHNGGKVITDSELNDSTVGRGIPALDADASSGGTITAIHGTYSLIKTGPIQEHSQIIAINDIALKHQSIYGTLQPPEDLFRIIFTPINLVRASCIINESDIYVDMKTVNVNRFSGVNSTSEHVGFAINLKCVEGTRVNLTLGNSNALFEFSGTIKLSSDSSAKGVGIQIVDENNVPVELGMMHFVTTATSTNISIPLAARYIQTEANIEPGSANGVLLFTINYI